MQAQCWSPIIVEFMARACFHNICSRAVRRRVLQGILLTKQPQGRTLATLPTGAGRSAVLDLTTASNTCELTAIRQRLMTLENVHCAVHRRSATPERHEMVKQPTRLHILSTMLNSGPHEVKRAGRHTLVVSGQCALDPAVRDAAPSIIMKQAPHRRLLPACVPLHAEAEPVERPR